MALASQGQGWISGSCCVHLSFQFSLVIAGQVQTSVLVGQRGQGQNQDGYGG